jgi:mRNA-degrading endonuclease RelE of RelBE toxin-antitoxin system
MPEKSWRVELSKSSLKSLKKLDKHVSGRILDRLEELGGLENPLRHKDVRPLEGKLRSFLRFRVGEHRIIFEIDSPNRRIGVLAIVARTNGYREKKSFRSL